MSAALSSRPPSPEERRAGPAEREIERQPPTHSSPLTVLRTLSGLELPGRSKNRCTARVKLRTARISKRSRRCRGSTRSRGRSEDVLTASAPPPVSS